MIPAMILLPLLAGVYWLFFRVSFLKNSFALSQLEIKQINDIPYIIQNGLPYQTGFYRTGRKKVRLENWDFRTAGGTEQSKVTVPHCFNTADSELKDFEGPVIYSCTYVIDENSGPCHLVFAGSFYKSSVYINERLVGANKGGYLPFRVPVDTGNVTGGVLHIKIEVDNRVTEDSLPSLVYPGHALGFHPYGGLHKEVYLEFMPHAYAFKVHAHPSIEDGKGHMRFDCLFHSPTDQTDPVYSSIRVFDPADRLIHERTEAITWKSDTGNSLFDVDHNDPVFWSHTNPALYKAVVRTGDDEVEIRFGFSSLKVEPGGFTHNSESILLKGVCRHEEELSRGLAQSHESMDRDLDLVKEMGMNYIRLSHYPHDSYFLDRSDEEGLHIWEEIPLYQAGLAPVKYISDKSSLRRDRGLKKLIKLPGMILRTGQLTKKSVLSQAHDDLVRMIERDFNHPSIGFWGIGNECWSLNPAGAKALRKLKGIINRKDPSRIAAYAAMTIPGLTTRFERAFKVMDFIGINEYFGWYYGNTEDLDGFLETIHRKHPGKPVMITETGPDCAYGQRSEQAVPEKGVSEEYQARYLKEQFRIMKSKPWFAGLSIWVLKDFLCPEYGTDNIVPFYNLKGLFTARYDRKAAADAVRDMYLEED